MNIRQMDVFRTVITMGSATSAAERLNMSQPAVSRFLAQFEDELGLELFIRAKGRLLPTPEALQLFDEVDSAFDSIQKVKRLATDLRSAATGSLQIMVPYSLSQGVLPGVLREFLAKNRDIKTSIAMGTYAAIERAVAMRKADIGFTKLPIDNPSVDIEPLPIVESVCVIQKRHPLAKRKKIKVEDLEDEPLVLLGRHRPSRYEIDKAFQARRVKQNVFIETHSVGTACAMVEEGLGIAIVNELMAAEYRSKDIFLIPFAPSVEHRFALIYPPNVPRSRLVKAFGKHFSEQLNKLNRK